MIAAKGQLKPPVQPIERAYSRAIDYLDRYGAGALFMKGGEVRFTRMDAPAFNSQVERLASGLVGVYDLGADARHVKEDLMEFYK